MSVRSFTCQAIVLKRSSFGETDRIVTILSKEWGKIACVAKGVRKLSSSRAAALEPGNEIKAHCLTTKSLPLLTQAALLTDTQEARRSLVKIRQLHQLLEIFDTLFVEEELDQDLYQMALELRSYVLTDKIPIRLIKQRLHQLLALLGYQGENTTQHTSVTEYISHLTDKKMNSYTFLVPKVV